MIHVTLTPKFRTAADKAGEDEDVTTTTSGAFVFGGAVMRTSSPTTVTITKPCVRTPFFHAFSYCRFESLGLSVVGPEQIRLPSTVHAEGARFTQLITTLFWSPVAGRGRGFHRMYLDIVWLANVALTGGCRRAKSSSGRWRVGQRGAGRRGAGRQRAAYQLPSSSTS